MSNEKYIQICSRIANHVRKTMDYCSNVDYQAFANNAMLQEACVFNVLQVGELAAKVIEYGYDKSHPDIPWHQMRGMRNRIVHDYDGVRLGSVWDTIQNDFPELSEALAAILR